MLLSPQNQSNPNGQLLHYTVDGRRIIHCYDPSHLIKTLRNNFEVKNLKHLILRRWSKDDPVFVQSPMAQTASWDHLFKLFKIDYESTERYMVKWTDEHLKPDKRKMKVSNAVEVLSNTCGTTILKYIEQEKLTDNFADTASAVFFLNDIFDSLNGSEKQKDDNSLKSAVKQNSVHFSFWQYALSVLGTMDFVDKETGNVNNKSSVLKKLESTIRGYEEFSKVCFSFGIPAVSIRYQTLLIQN